MKLEITILLFLQNVQKASFWCVPISGDFPWMQWYLVLHKCGTEVMTLHLMFLMSCLCSWIWWRQARWWYSFYRKTELSFSCQKSRVHKWKIESIHYPWCIIHDTRKEPQQSRTVSVGNKQKRKSQVGRLFQKSFWPCLIATEIDHKCQAWKGLLLVKSFHFPKHKQQRNEAFTVLSTLQSF